MRFRLLCGLLPSPLLLFAALLPCALAASGAPTNPGEATGAPPPMPFVYSHDPITKADRQAFDMKFGQSIRLSRAGDAAAKRGDWAVAANDYGGALALWQGSPFALYGLAKCAGKTGDLADELNDYRAAIYNPATPPHEPTFREVNTDKLMEYALLLDQTGQVAEAVRVYNHAVRGLNYDMGKPRLQVLLPEFGDAAGQVAYSSRKLEAMAHLAIGVFQPGFNDKELREAVSLAPDSAVAHYYLGKELWGTDNVGAKTELQQAVQLGNAQTVASAKKILQFIH